MTITGGGAREGAKKHITDLYCFLLLKEFGIKQKYSGYSQDFF